ncbi:Bug family tripartite tricarboxylate transporter substrate binding protein [Sphaerotilus sp.]|jgi:tripartite-type tricarboxylate transporter receptor subunit TctC|uniref:Bug family tripartite tricarboxylate transporter substrate binding protein n=1 Tax=Sphaerotilus sp. TaxID=2093942 RepID=UPI0025EF6E04|nr:tripartite tricarboxylate transporter substrate binding protein [Sphaerotilus sp.]
MIHTTRRDTLRQFGALTLAGLGTAATRALAQSDKPIRIVLPVATASGVDTITRAAQGALSKALGHPVMVENQPGAGGILGTTTLVRSAPDGFTLSFVSNNHVIYPSVYKSLPFDPINDITPIAIVGSTPLIVVVNPKVPANNARELAALLKAKAGDMTYGSSGNGTILHLAAEMFVDEAGATARHIPYKGVGPMLTDLIGGQVQIGVAALPSVQQHIKSGALRAIGTGAAQRLAAAPDIPTLVEQGMPGYQVEGWFGLIGPKGLPAADVKRLHDAVAVAFAAPDVVEAMARQGNTINVSTTEYAQAFFRSEMAKYAKLVKKAGIELQ